jgi:hypothetical protein
MINSYPSKTPLSPILISFSVSKKDIFLNQIFSIVRYHKLKIKDSYTIDTIIYKKAILIQLLLKENRI